MAVLGSALVLGSYCMGTEILSLTFGEEYGAHGPYLWRYMLMTFCFCCANVIVYFYLVQDRFLPVGLSLMAGLAQVLILLFFHDSILQVVNIQLALTGMLLLSTVCYHLAISVHPGFRVNLQSRSI